MVNQAVDVRVVACGEEVARQGNEASARLLHRCDQLSLTTGSVCPSTGAASPPRFLLHPQRRFEMITAIELVGAAIVDHFREAFQERFPLTPDCGTMGGDLCAIVHTVGNYAWFVHIAAVRSISRGRSATTSHAAKGKCEQTPGAWVLAATKFEATPVAPWWHGSRAPVLGLPLE